MPRTTSTLRNPFRRPPVPRRASWALGLAVFFCFGRGVPAQDLIQADRPGATDSAETLAAGRVQIEAGWQREEDGERHTLTTPALLRVGLTEGWEARVEGDGYARERGPEDGASGWQPVSLGVKHRLPGEWAGGATAGVIARVFPRSGSEAFRPRHTTGDLRLAGDWELTRRWGLGVNAGVGFYEDEGGAALVAGVLTASLAYAPSEALELFAEAVSQPPAPQGPRGASFYDVGLSYAVSRDVRIDLSAGGAADSEAPDRFIATGVSVRF